MADYQLSYVDFMPVCIKEAGFASLPKFEKFDTLVARCNDWLTQNPGVKIKTCESLEVPWRTKTSDNQLAVMDTNVSLFFESGNITRGYIRGLRLWFVPKGPSDDPNPVRLGYYNIVPGCIKSGGAFSMPQFEDFNATLEKVNAIFRNQPLQGSIINIETQDMKFQAWGKGIDPDESFWFEAAKGATCYLYCIRIFYAGGPTPMETIGCVDIVPQCTGSGFKVVGEPFSSICEKANTWISQHPGIRVTNIQSINYKVEVSFWKNKVQDINTMRAFYFKHGKGVTIFCRILRICYVMPMDGSGYHDLAPPTITQRTFAPAMVRPPKNDLMFNPKYETVMQNMTRTVSWLAHTQARVVAAETCTIALRRNGADPELTVTYDSGSGADAWLTVIRLYLDGHYRDPPLESLTAAPPMEEAVSNCCNIL